MFITEDIIWRLYGRIMEFVTVKATLYFYYIIHVLTWLRKLYSESGSVSIFNGPDQPRWNHMLLKRCSKVRILQGIAIRKKDICTCHNIIYVLNEFVFPGNFWIVQIPRIMDTFHLDIWEHNIYYIFIFSIVLVFDNFD